MTRSEMIDFIKANPFVPITHHLFDNSEYIYSDNYGSVLDENGNVFEDWFTPYMCDGIRIRAEEVWQSGWEVKKGIKLCKYLMNIPKVGLCCEAYSASKPTKENRWRHWANYPECKKENCPLKHPELLMGRTLEQED